MVSNLFYPKFVHKLSTICVHNFKPGYYLWITPLDPWYNFPPDLAALSPWADYIRFGDVDTNGWTPVDKLNFTAGLTTYQQTGENVMHTLPRKEDQK